MAASTFVDASPLVGVVAIGLMVVVLLSAVLPRVAHGVALPRMRRRPATHDPRRAVTNVRPRPHDWSVSRDWPADNYMRNDPPDGWEHWT